MFSPLKPPFYFDVNHDFLSWVVWLILFGVVVYGVGRSLETNLRWTKKDWILLVVLAGLTLVTSSFFGVHLLVSGGLPRPERPDVPTGPILMFLAALPWMLACGWLGVLPAVLLAALSGLIIGSLDTHSLFIPLEGAALALFASLMLRQKYRTPFYRFLRHPLAASFLLTGISLVLSLISLVVTTTGALVSRLDFAFTHLPGIILAMGAELLIAGLITEVISHALPRWWGRPGPLVSSPAETRLQLRFFAGAVPWVMLAMVIVMVGDWIVSERAAHQMLETQLGSIARLAAEGVPFFLESGQTLVKQIAADPQVKAASGEGAQVVLAQTLSSQPFFRQLSLIDKNGLLVAGYPLNELAVINQTVEEQLGIRLALKGVEVQTYSVPPMRDDKAAQVAFITTIQDDAGNITGVLWARADLASNPYTQPAIKALDEVAALGGAGQIVDENGKILYDPQSGRLMEDYQGQPYTTAIFYDETGASGMRQLVYYQPAVGRHWAVVLTVPASQVQQLAMQTAVPLLMLIMAFVLAAYLSLSWVLGRVTVSLGSLAEAAGMIAQGKLDHALPITTDVDEAGQLRQAFEKMRLGWKNQLDELNRLLQVSQGVASSLEIEGAIQPILNAALYNGACLARVVLLEPSITEPFAQSTRSFSQGTASETFKELDAEILNLSRQRVFAINNFTRGRGLNIPSRAPRPAALIALPLRHENQFFGVLWVGYSEIRQFSEEETRFLSTLAAQAALAASNNSLYETAEIGRQQLEAVLAATPDPVLVTDQHNRILLTNPAFIQLPGLEEDASKGQPVQDAISQKDLLKLISQSTGSETTREIKLTNDRTYYATTSTVEVDGSLVGKICILRDITHFKELDTLKSEFVATVSHDLRSPLTLMRGYATMLPLVGDLNEQQKNFVKRIVGGIETMSRLVSSLLDLGRIEAGVGLKLEKIAPGEILERVAGLLQLQAAQKSIQMEIILPEGQNPIITADGALLQQALYNLMENAIKYTSLNGSVKASLQLRQDTILFSIRDTGMGIAPLDQPRLFEKFYRGGQREARQQRGTGLGLAIVKSIAERHGGKVWLESQLGKGSTFYLEIPITAHLEPAATPTS